MMLRFLSAPALIGLSLACASKQPEDDATKLQQVVVPSASQSATSAPARTTSAAAPVVSVAPAMSSAPAVVAAPAMSSASPSTASGAPSVLAPAMSGTAPMTPATPPCTDIKPDDRPTTCAEWAVNECESSWIKDKGFCNASCKRCKLAPATSGTVAPAGSSMMSSMGSLGDDNPYPMGVTNGKDVYLTRYWDCAKPSCGWPDKGQVASCNRDNQKIGVSNEQSGANGGNAYTCFGMRPWAHSNVLSYGYMATPVQGASCGKCYLVQFTGTGKYNDADPGSQTLKGKMMVVMATNIGGDVNSNQFDLLIPGGGIGKVNACGNQKVAAPMAIYGGYATDCKNDKACVKQKCDQAFADSKYADLKAGCDWFVEWYNVADNPNAKYQEISCPQELVARSK